MITRVKNALVRRYWRVRMSPPLWRLINRSRVRAWKTVGPQGAPHERRIADALRTDGIAFSSLQELGLEHLWPAMQADARALKQRWVSDASFREHILGELASKEIAKGAKKTFLLPLYGGGWTTPVLESENPYIQFSLSDTVLTIAGMYLGLIAKFDSFNLSETVLVAGDAKFSQRWHRDPEDRRLLKAFIYVSDVLDDGAGPFTYVRGSQEGGRYHHLFPQQFPQGSYPAAEALERAVHPKDIQKAFGKAGTVVFADTAGLHRGGFSTTQERMMYTAGYVAATSTQSRKFTIMEAPAGLSILAAGALTAQTYTL